MCMRERGIGDSYPPEKRQTDRQNESVCGWQRGTDTRLK